MNTKILPKFPAQKIHTSIGQVKPRPQNPTYFSTFMNASLCNLSPPSQYTKNLIKETSYKSYFDKPTGGSLHLQQNTINYHRYSNQALHRKQSNLSSYGANLLN